MITLLIIIIQYICGTEIVDQYINNIIAYKYILYSHDNNVLVTPSRFRTFMCSLNM